LLIVEIFLRFEFFAIVILYKLFPDLLGGFGIYS